jgi:hypothetical protein
MVGKGCGGITVTLSGRAVAPAAFSVSGSGDQSWRLALGFISRAFEGRKTTRKIFENSVCKSKAALVPA